MNDALAAFASGVADLERFLAASECEARLTESLWSHSEDLQDQEKKWLSTIVPSQTNRKRYVYSVAIISLYGLLERFVEELMVAYVTRVSRCFARYELLPGAIQKNHVAASIDLLKVIPEDRYRTSLSEADVISNLHSCLSGSAEFSINGEAFALHRGNITLQKISEFMGKVGISGYSKRALISSEFSAWFRKAGRAPDIRAAPDSEVPNLLRPLNDLVERRNQLAHGIIVSDDIESIELLNERCGFILTFGKALFRVMQQEFFLYQSQQSNILRLGKSILVVRHKIACFEISVGTLGVGDTLVAVTHDPLQPCFFSKILNIQIDKENVLRVTASYPVKL